MLIGARTTMMNAGPPALPYDAEIEYLESTGTQVINLGDPVYAEWDVGLYPVEPTVTSNYSKYYCGSNNNGSRTNSVWAADSSALNFTNYNREGLTVPCTLVAWHDIQVRAQTVTVDSTPYQYTLGAYGSRNGLNLFGSLYGISYVGVKCRISYFKGYIDGNVATDLIPVRVGTAGGLYDRANPTGGPLGNGLYLNSGTGDFVLGRDVNPISARSYVKDGLVAMWDSIENAGWGAHDSTSQTWKELISGSDIDVSGKGAFGDNVFAVSTRMIGTINTQAMRNAIGTSVFTAEVMFLSAAVNAGIYMWGSPQAFNMTTLSDYAIRFYSGGTVISETAAQSGLKAGVCSVSRSGTQAIAYYNGTQLGNETTCAAIGTPSNGLDIPASRSVHCIRIYSRALTADEIAANYTIDAARFNLPQAS